MTREEKKRIMLEILEEIPMDAPCLIPNLDAVLDYSDEDFNNMVMELYRLDVKRRVETTDVDEEDDLLFEEE